MIGIIAALKDEVRDIKNKMTQVQTSEKAGMTFYRGLLSGKPAVAVMCGVGKVNAALCAQILVDLFDVDCLINVGVGGAVAKGLTVGDIVISKDSVQYDMDGSAFGHPRGEIPNMDITFFPADERLIGLAKDAAARVGQAALVGRVMTADLGVDSQALKQELTQLFGGACVEMEGAAIGQAAFINQIPYIVIRSISDNADGDLVETYQNNFQTSVVNAAKMVLEMVENY
ncbi:5'-methylthioadenosine/adenosylhomocysteine nucleosidase [Eubacterium sp. 1001713B170207_170306_E7]|uniref:5'-methylthioadenosine/adenosylhomocysteine nucleosidase n=1 Tax=Eubacterium sp. 1001713B170207_170306_E7 TaxID=2787097 RepID=UPI0018979981|nr:5'-methylthioadenosine/adenosylhomocysteine nucleosidase [Eubacterium sp. 1001713B170207_170306_E7]